MKLSITILLLTFNIFNNSKSFGQCEDLSFLNTLFIGSVEDIDGKLTNKNYVFQKEMVTGIDWRNNSSGKSISVLFNSNNKVERVQYRLLYDLDCYDNLRTQMLNTGFQKEFEVLGEYDTFYFFYRGKNKGVVLSKWNFEGSNMYQFNLCSIGQYELELTKRKK
ncbi:hypothetical protein BC792_13048 [Sphingobacterium allocomposti]|uniref:Uncharacterized protein n=1 Tax=Sphingobacterium allocomposti TaxID=415956 RepID=A0A5S5D0W3_9SPHI|nr:hypothetical protein [Sphingobacterium composti Yoo et al. 2007 non Ten et al. 2007]TYP88746.1 hypothetical protein BC792_13048 [Sphingobacterium composti Yoo et al. 2007 non Ten et al. 2007]